MRVTDQFRYRTVIRNLNSSRERMTDLQEQLATGKRINRPSDDPVSMSKAAKLRTILESNYQFQENIQDAKTQLTVQEQALNEVHDTLLEIKEIAIEGASDSITVRESLADQVEQILDSLVEVANTRYNGKYIFGGTETLTVPFVLDQNVINFDLNDPVVQYYGNGDKLKRQINETMTVDVNLTGKEVFDQSDGEGVDIFQMVYELKKGLENDDTSAVNGKIEDIDTALEQVLESYLKVGTRVQVVAFNEERFESQNIQIKSAMSYLEDTDFGTAYVNFEAEENALNSALSAGARVVAPSLLDFVGA